MKINLSTSTEYDTKINTYIEAIELYPNKPEAYIKMIEAYADNGGFTSKESAVFLKYYNSNYGEAINDDEVISNNEAELYYQAGVLYFYMYSETEHENDGDNILKTRALKALPFFVKIVEYGNSNYVNYDLAKHYYTVYTNQLIE